MFKGMMSMSDDRKATIRFYVEMGAILVAATASWVVLSGKAEQAIERIDKMERKQVESDIAVGKLVTDVEVTKNNVQWIRENMEKSKR